MAESKSAMRRTTRVFAEEQQPLVIGAVMGYEPKQTTGDEKERDRPRDAVTSSSNMDVIRLSVVDLGAEICPSFTTTTEHIRNQAVTCIQAANASNPAKRDLRPDINFGVVFPGDIYRSSYPTEADHAYLATLGLKTILSLVKKDPFPADFDSFMRSNDIRHCIIDMPGTKKVKIPEAIMHSIMEVVLDQSNYPLLIHCNHGKHRTGCVVAVLRHVKGWHIDAVLDEYRGYAKDKPRDVDVAYIKQYQVSSLQGLLVNKSRSLALSQNRIARVLVLTAILIMLIFTTASFW